MSWVCWGAVKISNIFGFWIFTRQCSNILQVTWKSLWYVHRQFSYESPGERILKIGPRLPKLSNIKWLTFLEHDVPVFCYSTVNGWFSYELRCFFKNVICRSTTPQQWEDYSRYNKERADAEMANSRRLREANHHVIQQTDNDLATQQAATDYALRKRIHELERALDELRWQKQQVPI